MATKLTWRDALMLPLIAGCTVLGMMVVAEVGTRIAYPEHKENSCAVHDKTIYGYHLKAGCVSRMKTAEGPWYTNHYNACGYRSDSDCGPVPPGVRRIAVIGASISEGFMVEYPHTIGASLQRDLTALCRAPVDVQNMAATGYTGQRLAPRMTEALGLHPQAVILVQTPVDIETQLNASDMPFTDARDPVPPADVKAAPLAGASDVKNTGLIKQLTHQMHESRAVVVAQHFMFQDASFYVPLFMAYGDKAAFLRPPFTAAWRERLHRFDLLITALTDRAHAAGVPFALVFVPHQAEIAIEAGQARPTGVDPLALPKALEEITHRHGAIFIDVSSALLARRNPAQLYYRVDGHPSGKGQPVIGLEIARQLAALRPGPFADCRAPQVVATNAR